MAIPEREPDKLAANHCLKQSLRSFAAGGGRIYAEGSGWPISAARWCFPAGVRPDDRAVAATARWLGPTLTREPVEVTFARSSWLAPANVSLRGYRHNGWQIEPRGPMITYAAGAEQRLDILGRGNVIGSRVWSTLRPTGIFYGDFSSHMRRRACPHERLTERRREPFFTNCHCLSSYAGCGNWLPRALATRFDLGRGFFSAMRRRYSRLSLNIGFGVDDQDAMCHGHWR